MDILTHFAAHLGRFVLFQEQEIRLDGIRQNYIECFSDKQELVKAEDCKLIFDNETDYYKSDAPYFISVIRKDNGYVNTATIKPEPAYKIDEQILEQICKCAMTDEDGLREKTRKREIVQGRQLHMALMKEIIYPERSLSMVGWTYRKDHATVLHSIKKVTFSVTSKYDLEFRERFRPVWEIVKRKYPKQVKFNVSWL